MKSRDKVVFTRGSFALYNHFYCWKNHIQNAQHAKFRKSLSIQSFFYLANPVPIYSYIPVTPTLNELSPPVSEATFSPSPTIFYHPQPDPLNNLNIDGAGRIEQQPIPTELKDLPSNGCQEFKAQAESEKLPRSLTMI